MNAQENAIGRRSRDVGVMRSRSGSSMGLNRTGGDADPPGHGGAVTGRTTAETVRRLAAARRARTIAAAARKASGSRARPVW